MRYGKLSYGSHGYADVIFGRIELYISMHLDYVFDFVNISSVSTDVVFDVTSVASRFPDNRAAGCYYCKMG